jgi:hypothetical protein
MRALLLSRSPRAASRPLAGSIRLAAARRALPRRSFALNARGRGGVLRALLPGFEKEVVDLHRCWP